MSDYPERISISPVHRHKHDDDFYLVDRKAFPGKGTEYVRADRIEELEAKLSKVVEVLEYADRMVRLDLRHMTDVDCEDFSQAVVDTGKRIKVTLAELKGETDE